MKFRGPVRKISLLVALLLIVSLPLTAFHVYRHYKTAHEIARTINSRYWNQRYREFKSEPVTDDAIIFAGDSLISSYDLTVFNNQRVMNRGIGGDFTEGLLERLDEITTRKPKKVFLEIGINDVIEKVPVDSLLHNYEQIIQRIQAETPTTRIYIQSLLPVRLAKRGEKSHGMVESWLTTTSMINDTVKECNARLELLSVRYHVVFIDLYPLLLEGDRLKQEFTTDGVHLTKAGYAVWQELIQKYVQE